MHNQIKDQVSPRAKKEALCHQSLENNSLFQFHERILHKGGLFKGHFTQGFDVLYFLNIYISLQKVDLKFVCTGLFLVLEYSVLATPVVRKRRKKYSKTVVQNS